MSSSNNRKYLSINLQLYHCGISFHNLRFRMLMILRQRIIYGNLKNIFSVIYHSLCNDKQFTEMFFLYLCCLTHFLSTALFWSRQRRKVYYFHIRFRFNLVWPCRLSYFDPLILTCWYYSLFSSCLKSYPLSRKSSKRWVNFCL